MSVCEYANTKVHILRATFADISVSLFPHLSSSLHTPSLSPSSLHCWFSPLLIHRAFNILSPWQRSSHFLFNCHQMHVWSVHQMLIGSIVLHRHRRTLWLKQRFRCFFDFTHRLKDVFLFLTQTHNHKIKQRMYKLCLSAQFHVAVPSIF